MREPVALPNVVTPVVDAGADRCSGCGHILVDEGAGRSADCGHPTSG